jgi:hypothetical protein
VAFGREPRAPTRLTLDERGGLHVPQGKSGQCAQKAESKSQHPFCNFEVIVRGESQKRCLLFCEALGPSSFLLPKHPRIAICEINIVVQQQSLVSFGLAQ